MADPRSILALQFDSALRANEFVATAVRMASEGELLVHDAVFVTKDTDGTAFVTETTDLTTGRGAWGGTVWGGLFGLLLGVPIAGMAIGAGLGALSGKVTDLGVDNEFVAQMKEAVSPGKTVLVLLVSHVDDVALHTQLTRFPGVELISSDLSPQAHNLVVDALASS